ncbi:MAG TPA: hypothetical protein VGK67_28840 [Myxococcales bacterium]
MHSPTPWPQLSWDAAATGAALEGRIREIARLARRFEAALEQAAEQELADLSRIDEALTAWDRAAAEVFVHTAFGEGKPIAPAEAPARAKALKKAWDELCRLRAQMLDGLGEAAEGVLEREPNVAIDEAMLAVGQGMPEQEYDSEESESAFFQDQPAENFRHLPEDDEPPEHIDGEIEDGQAFLGDDDMESAEASAKKNFDHLSGAKPAPKVEAPVASPVRPEEVRQRQAAQAKPYPGTGNLSALLALLPVEWIVAIHQRLKLPAAGDEELSAGSRSALLRGPVHAFLKNPAKLAEVVAALGDKEKEILSALLRLGALNYSKATAKWGLDDADGYCWSERPPAGPLSVLRRTGLAFVCTQSGQPVVAAPTDLVDELRKLLGKA